MSLCWTSVAVFSNMPTDPCEGEERSTVSGSGVGELMGVEESAGEVTILLSVVGVIAVSELLALQGEDDNSGCTGLFKLSA